MPSRLDGTLQGPEWCVHGMPDRLGCSLQAIKNLLRWVRPFHGPQRLRKLWLPAVLLLAVSCERFDEGQKVDILQGIERLLWLTLLSKGNPRWRDARWNRVNQSLQAGKTLRVNLARIGCGD